jgi:predicted transposase YdaD
MAIDHDHLFKELLGEFFPEFIDLFFPRVATYLDRRSLEFQPQEIFADLSEGSTFKTDVVVKAKFFGKPSYFIIHVEHQAKFDRFFDYRMFNYFALLHRNYRLPVYPIVIFSHRSPRQGGDRFYRIEFPDWQVLQFNYRAVRLNHLPWREFTNQLNPVASAFMAKMKMRRRERPQVKLACLQSLTQLELNSVQTKMLSGFIDTYLKLEPLENQIFLERLDRIKPKEKEGIMQIVTSWMEEGLEKGLEKGREKEVALILRLLRRRIGSIPSVLERDIASLSFEQLENLAEALLDFTSDADLGAWLQESDLTHVE